MSERERVAALIGWLDATEAHCETEDWDSPLPVGAADLVRGLVASVARLEVASHDWRMKYEATVAAWAESQRYREEDGRRFDRLIETLSATPQPCPRCQSAAPALAAQGAP